MTYIHVTEKSDDDDDMLCNGSEGDGNIRSKCGEDEGNDCEDADSDTNWVKEDRI